MSYIRSRISVAAEDLKKNQDVLNRVETKNPSVRQSLTEDAKFLIQSCFDIL